MKKGCFHGILMGFLTQQFVEYVLQRSDGD
jgi:hypothetical protein